MRGCFRIEAIKPKLKILFQPNINKFTNNIIMMSFDNLSPVESYGFTLIR